MARKASSRQGQLQHLASQQANEARLKCVNQLWEKNSARVHSVTSDAHGVHAAAIAVGVTAGTRDLEGRAVVPSDDLCSGGPWVDVRCALVVIRTKYSGVCFKKRMLQRTVFINKIRMLQRTWRNTIGRRSTRVRMTCLAFPL